ncbi:TetR/AcrR family transcriptional regulator [Ferrovibrio sp.]|uniref:TetR/AcrR family transcriptional regulator n=1 Tax=Ferrovibrio sp. TaxID=1917215 RepID=UPI0025BD7214|nr:TetR/AcrR family transcriptional regulator [Ferrovibrio sp.]MBX3454408.1 TetR/AcrR family transcriptional regulator [Ferrovibrio sp.]
MPKPAINPRKRPRQTRSAATFDLVLEAAARILERGGLAAFNTNAIAERAGISIGSLYQYFPTKEAILAELIRRKRNILLGHMQTAAQQGQSARLAPAIDALIDAGIAHQLSRPNLARSLEYAESLLPITTETETLKQQIVHAIASVLAAHGIADPALAARDLAALTRGMIDSAGLFGETDAASLRNRVRRAVFGYLGIPQGKRRQAV